MFDIPYYHVRNVIESGKYSDANASLIEECGELISAIAKYEQENLDYTYDTFRNKLIEEMTHVLISMNMVAMLYSIGQEDILQEIRRKAANAGYDLSNYV